MRLRVPTTRSRPGVVLVAVLVVLVLLTLAAYQYSERMMAEAKAADSFYRVAQTRALAESGIYYVAALLSNTDTVTNTLNGNPYENPGVYQGVLVYQDPLGGRRNGRFCVVALRDPADPQSTSSPWRFGVEDEAGKINVNALLALDGGQGTAAYNMLMLLPNMTQDIANAILDWLDPDDTPRENGAENDYYTTLPQPYQCKNGPLDSLEEMLLIKGVTPQLLFGNDLNRNGFLDPEEDDGSGQVDLGWSAYFTIYSRELNVDYQGNPRIYLNDSDLNTLANNLTPVVGQDLADFITAYLLYGSSSGSGSSGSSGGSGGGATGGAGGNRGGSGASGGASGGSGGAAAGGANARLSNSDVDAVRSTLNNARSNSSGSSSSSGSGSSRQRLTSLFSLINATVSVPVGSGNQQRNVQMYNPLKDPSQLPTLLPLLLDETTTSNQPELTPRININTAPQAVLAALPGGLTPDQIQTIISTRPPTLADAAPSTAFQTPAWLYTTANIPMSILQQLENYITAHTFVYRVQSIGYYDNGGASSRLEAVIDTNLGRPRIVMLRDLTSLGNKAFNLGGN